MTFHDPTSYADLSQGRIEHIDFHIRVNFESRTLDVEAMYQMQESVHGSLYLETYKLQIQEARADDQQLAWEFDTSDETLGERLHLKGLASASSFILKFRTSPEARALQYQWAGGRLGETLWSQHLGQRRWRHHLQRLLQPAGGAVRVGDDEGVGVRRDLQLGQNAADRSRDSALGTREPLLGDILRAIVDDPDIEV